MMGISIWRLHVILVPTTEKLVFIFFHLMPHECDWVGPRYLR